MWGGFVRDGNGKRQCHWRKKTFPSPFLKVGEQYTADQIRVLEGLEAIRKRPGMYIGDTSYRGLHHCVYEIVDNAVDEALAGYCTEIRVIVHVDNSVTVIDNGRGIPVGIHGQEGVSAAEVVYTKLHAGGKFNEEGGAYKVSGGLHGVGAAVVNALSKWVKLEIKKDGKLYILEFASGVAKEPLKAAGDLEDSEATGTAVTFKPDNEIFEVLEFNQDTLTNRFREMAFLNKGLKIFFKDERSEKKRNFFLWRRPSRLCRISQQIEDADSQKSHFHHPADEGLRGRDRLAMDGLLHGSYSRLR